MNNTDFLSSDIRNIALSGTVEVSNKIQEAQRQGKDLISLSIGEPDFPTPQAIREAMRKAINQGQTHYISSSGLMELREKISSKLSTENQLSYDPEQIIVSCGAKHAIYQGLEVLLDQGDEVIIPVPYWVSYPEMVKSIGGRPTFLSPSDENGKITPSELDRVTSPKTKVLILNSPNNPSGGVYSAGALEKIVEWAEQNDVFIISDEIYEYFVYGSKSHVSPASLNRKGYNRILTVNGFSKAFAMTGLRVGYAAGPEWFMEKMKILQSHTTTHTSSISQHGAIAAFDLPSSFTDEKVQQYEKRRNAVMESLDQIPSLSYIQPEGAFYVFVNLDPLLDSEPSTSRTHSRDTNIQTSRAFFQQLLEEKGVAVIPGSAFGTENAIRISYTADLQTVRNGMEKFKDFVESLH